MHYAYQLRAHANARYQDSLLSLSIKELRCMLLACGVDAVVTPRQMGTAPFLCFTCDTLTPRQSAWLNAHSGVYMTCALENDLLRPLESASAAYLPGSMPDVLKYKGKTNAAFTRLLINLALSAGGRWDARALSVLDPLCGRGTTLFCALERGMDATGIESDAKELHEALAYAQNFLQYHREKHALTHESLTLPQGKSAKLERLTIRGEREMNLVNADTRDAAALFRKRRFSALVADLPYGVQHAPQNGKRLDTLETLMRQALPAWKSVLQPGAAMAISFNTYTLSRDVLRAFMLEAGLHPLDEEPYGAFTHWVEQAVNRDILVAVNANE